MLLSLSLSSSEATYNLEEEPISRRAAATCCATREELFTQRRNFSCLYLILRESPKGATAEDGRMMAGKLNPSNVMIIEKKQHGGGTLDLRACTWRGYVFFLAFLLFGRPLVTLLAN